MENREVETSKSFPANEPEQDLYTIPSYSSWFSWEEIHETEKIHLREFFDGSSISRTPKIYKEYRDFIINKFREEPSRKLTFTEIRKSLIGDVNLMHKVFLFLEKWGLINFGETTLDNLMTVVEGDERQKVRFEEGAPSGIRVVALPNSSKAVTLPPIANDTGETMENGFGLPPLASYSDVFGDLMHQKRSVCGNCGEYCVSGRYESTVGSFVICLKCFKNENYGGSRSSDDFKFNDCTESIGNQQASSWTDSETLLILESVLKHGDDWDLVVQNVRTKSKIDCISRIIQLPFGEHMLGSANGKGDSRTANGNMNNAKYVHSTSVEPQVPIKTEDQGHKNEKENEHIAHGEIQGPPLKRRCVSSVADDGGSSMKQVALLSATMGPDIAAAAAKAVVTVLCNENPCISDMFEGEDNVTNDFDYPTMDKEPERVLKVEDAEMGEGCTQSGMQEAPSQKHSIPQTLRIKVAIATALGAAAAHAKLLADQEDREIEHLMATVIETQLRKIHCKIKHFEELELIMEKEYTQIQELKESIISERVNVLRQAFNAGIFRRRDQTPVKSLAGSVF